MKRIGFGFLERPSVREQLGPACKAEELGQQPHFARALEFPPDRLAEIKSLMGRPWTWSATTSSTI